MPFCILQKLISVTFHKFRIIFIRNYRCLPSDRLKMNSDRRILAAKERKKIRKGIGDVRDITMTMVVRRPEKRKATRDRVNVFVSKAAPVETRVILHDPTLSSRTYFASFQPSQPRLLFHTRYSTFPRIFHRDSFSPCVKYEIMLSSGRFERGWIFIPKQAAQIKFISIAYSSSNSLSTRRNHFTRLICRNYISSKINDRFQN